MCDPRKTLVLGLGNPLRGDDGIGAAVIERLQQQDTPPHVTLLDGGTPGLETILLLQDYPRVIIIDAADMQRRAGEWAVFAREDVLLRSGDLHQRVTVHYADLSEALTLGEAMNLLPDEITIIGIQPLSTGWEIGLSAPVSAAIDEVCQAVFSLV